MLYAILIVGGIIIGVVSTVIFFKVKKIGVLRVDKSDPNENPYLFLELKRSVGVIEQKKYVILAVNNQSYISHK